MSRFVLMISAGVLSLAGFCSIVSGAEPETSATPSPLLPDTWMAASLDDQFVVHVVDDTHVEICGPMFDDHTFGSQAGRWDRSTSWKFSRCEFTGRMKNEALVMELKAGAQPREVVFTRADQATVDEILERLKVIKVGLLQAMALHGAPPTPLVRIRPAYPEEMKRAGIKGSVTVQFGVNPIGLVTEASVVQSTRPEFEPAALAAIRQWIFRPGIRNGEFVSARLAQELVFNPEAVAASPAPVPE